MASLTYTAYVSRKLIKYGGSGLIAFMLLWSIGVTMINAYKASHPKYIPPTVRYGVLPKLVFPEKQFDKKTFNFEFTNDKIPTFDDQAKVYIIYRPTSKILALEDAKKVATQFGFKNDPVEIDEGVYKFEGDNRTLTMNVLEGNFDLKYPYTDDQSIIENSGKTSKATAIETASGFLKSGSKFSSDLEEGEKVASFWKIEEGTLKSVSAQSEANVVRVDFYRKKMDDKWNVTSAKTNQSSVTVLVSGDKVVEANFKYADIDRESFSTYPIKTAEEAIEDLKAGNYWPANEVNSTSATIRGLELAYYEPVTLTQYVQPIYIFKGDNNFTAFVSAIANNYIAK